MSQINSSANESSGSSRKRAGVRRMLKHNLKIDMTPMADLGFLLISFFVITTELSKPTTMDLIMPADGGPPIESGDSNALTVLLDKNNTIWYYQGSWEKAVRNATIIKTTFSSRNDLRKAITAKQQWLDVHDKKEGRGGLMLLVKPARNASYKNLVDVLDEVTINQVKKYAVIKLSAEEKNWIEQHQ